MRKRCLAARSPFAATRRPLVVCCLLAAIPAALRAAETPRAPTTSTVASARASQNDAAPIAWSADYAQAYAQAKSGRQMLVIYLESTSDACRHFANAVVRAPEVIALLHNDVCLRLPIDATVTTAAGAITLAKDPAFEKLGGQPGVAMIDLSTPGAAYYGRVVTALPFTPTHCYSPAQLEIALTLPHASAAERARRFAESWAARALAAETARDQTSAPRAPHEEPAPAIPPAKPSPTTPAEKPSSIPPTKGSAANGSSEIAKINEAAATPPAVATDAAAAAPVIAWHNDYATAYAEAERRQRMLLVYFEPPDAALKARFARETLADPQIQQRLAGYVCARLGVDATIVSDGKPIVLLKESAFGEMLGQPGIAIVDLAHKGQEEYRSVVSAFPFTPQWWYGPRKMAVILDLPPGTLTQRTLIYAVRTHPEAPASTNGEISNALLSEAEGHANYQARVHVQGHQQWASRFQRINAILPAGCTAKEVCAESWPGEGLLEAALDCVHSWRQSSGHWGAVRSWQRVYGYDMKRGSNGIWYATGIFGR